MIRKPLPGFCRYQVFPSSKALDLVFPQAYTKPSFSILNTFQFPLLCTQESQRHSACSRKTLNIYVGRILKTILKGFSTQNALYTPAAFHHCAARAGTDKHGGNSAAMAGREPHRGFHRCALPGLNFIYALPRMVESTQSGRGLSAITSLNESNIALRSAI